MKLVKAVTDRQTETATESKLAKKIIHIVKFKVRDQVTLTLTCTLH